MRKIAWSVSPWQVCRGSAFRGQRDCGKGFRVLHLLLAFCYFEIFSQKFDEDSWACARHLRVERISIRQVYVFHVIPLP